MERFNAQTAYVTQHPVRTGVMVVLMVLALGALSAYALGFNAPTAAEAQVAPTPVAPVIVTAPPVTPTPVVPVIIPTPVIVPVVTPTPVTVSGVTVTASPSTDTGSVPSTDSGSPTTTTSPFTLPCCTLPTESPTTVDVTTPTVVTPPVIVVPPITTPPVLPPPPVDVCPNIDGMQSDIPSGMTKDGSGNCVPPSGVAPTCTLAASASSVAPGSSITLSWTTTNAASGSLNNGLGAASPIAAGTRTATVSANTTYTLTAVGTNGQTVTCSAPVTVTTTNPHTPACTLAASASSVAPGGTVTLSWTSQNLISAAINQGIGSISPLAAGSRTVTVNANTTYTMTGMGTNGQTVTCSAPVTVTTSTPAPTCTLAASASSVAPGTSVGLTWTTTNAASAAIDQGIGAVTPLAGGATSAVVTANTTYTMTVVGTNGQTITCAAPVTVTTGGGGPSCTLSASPTSIKKGETATITWGGTRISSVFIDQGIGTTTTTSGSTSVSPSTVGTHTYTGSFLATNGNTLTCTASIEVTEDTGGCTSGCGGGGRKNPRVVLSSLKTPDEQDLAFVYLSQIPYTGLELGPWGTAFYWVMLILWSLAAAYLIFFTALPFAFARVRAFGGKVQSALNDSLAMSAHAPAAAHGHDAHNASTAHSAHAAPAAHGAHSAAHGHDAHGHGHHEPKPEPVPTRAKDGFRAFGTTGALSIDDIVKGLAREAAAHPSASAHDLPLDFAHAPAAPVHHEPVIEHEQHAPVAPVAHAPVAASHAQVVVSHDVRDFLAALIAGDRDTVFGTIRAITRQGGDSEEFLTHAVCALDDAYRAQVDGSVCHPDIKALTAHCHPSFLERLVTSLTTAVDGSYSTGVTGVKLALTRALAVVNG